MVHWASYQWRSEKANRLPECDRLLSRAARLENEMG